MSSSRFGRDDTLKRNVPGDARAASAGNLGERSRPAEPPICPYCRRIMTWREKDEQGACNDCYGGAWSPEPDA